MRDDMVWPGQERAAEHLVEVLTAAILPVAESRPRMPSTAVTPEAVDTIKALSKLGQALPDFCRRAFLGEIHSGAWATLADILGQASHVCQRQVVIIDIRDGGDSGSS